MGPCVRNALVASDESDVPEDDVDDDPVRVDDSDKPGDVGLTSLL
jgi:hypothetical protein